MSRRARDAAAWVLVVLCVVLSTAALLVGYADRAAFDSDQFANRATAALRDERVRAVIAERVTGDVVLAREPDLVTARPLIASVVSSVVGGRAFTGLFRAGVRDVHRAVLARDQDTVTLTVRDIGAVVAAGLQVVRPQLAERVRADRSVTLVDRHLGDPAAGAVRAANAARILAWVLLGAAVLTAAGALALARDRRRAVIRLGAGLAIAGVLVVVGLRAGRAIALDRVAAGDDRDAAAAVWDAFLGDLSTAAWLLAACGAVVAASAASLLRPVELHEPLRRAWRWAVRTPDRPVARVARGAALVAAGVVTVLAPDTVLQLVLTAAGVYLVYAGVTAILQVVAQPRPAEQPRATSAAAPRRRWRAATSGLVAAAAVTAAVALFLGTGGVTTAAPAAGPCDGHRALCGRSLEDVALPATHNAMSAAVPGWFAAQQDRPIPDQLRDGVRGLLIDTHYADRLANGRLRTELAGGKLGDLVQQDGVSPEAVQAALRTRERLGFAGRGTRGMYLCHTLCELGGAALEPVLQELHDFLVANPGEVVVVINQDYVTPEDFVGAVRDAGLAGMAYRGPTGRGQWPTLQQMIDRGERIVFLAEHHAGAAPWYRLAYRAVAQETPFTFTRTRQLTDPELLPASCEEHRGPATAPLFLVNHWITTDPVPRPSNARVVNGYEPLLRRLRTCERLRRHLPNLVAVDFYREGDLFRAVDALNGVGPDGPR